MMTARLSNDLLDTAAEKLSCGMMLKDICAEHGCCRNALSRALKVRRGINVKALYRPASNAKKIDRGEMVRRYVAGESVFALANFYGISRNTITDHLKRIGMDIRNGSAANRIRMSKMSHDQRRELTQPANNAVRGIPKTVFEKTQNAIGRLDARSHKGFLEDELSDALRATGVSVDQQATLDFYNIDILVNGSLAVEVSTRRFACLMRDRPHKIEKLIEAGIPLFYIEISSKEAGELCLDQIIADFKSFYFDPTGFSKHRVVRCRVKTSTVGKDNSGCFTSVKTPKQAIYSVVREYCI